VTYWLDRTPKADPSKVEIRIEMPGIGGGLPGLDMPGGLPGLTPPPPAPQN
jgi:hypothetical protein